MRLFDSPPICSCPTEIPYSMSSGTCQVKIPIKHLTNTESKCLQTIESIQRVQSSLEGQLKSSKILKWPKELSTDAVIMADHCKTSNKSESDNCVDIFTFYCVGSITKSNCKSNSTAEPSIANHISIQFMHNFTHILNCSVFFVSREPNLLENDEASEWLLQTILVRYVDVNDTFFRSKTQQVSGNLGYLSHKPMIMTKYIVANESADANKLDGTANDLILAYFHENGTNNYNDEYFLKIPTIDDRNECFIDNSTFETINFGENSITRCFVRLAEDSVVRDTDTGNSTTDSNLTIAAEAIDRNFTLICRSIQRQIFQQILHRLEQANTNSTAYDDFNVQISQLGNPKNESRLWIKLEAINPQMNLGQITGVYDKKANENEFMCRNIVLSVRYEFYYAVVMLGSRANQAMVKKATIEFGPRLVLNFKLDEELKVPAYIDIMFHDLTGISTGAGDSPRVSLGVSSISALFTFTLMVISSQVA